MSPGYITYTYPDDYVHELLRGYVARASAERVKLHFGLHEWENWPIEGMTRRRVQGLILYVRSVSDARAKHPQSRRPRRLMAVCPECGQHFGYGGLQQHVKFKHG